MWKKIYEELVAIRKELQAMHKDVELKVTVKPQISAEELSRQIQVRLQEQIRERSD